MHEGRSPETWFIQIDGGSENANKYFLATLEFFVGKVLVKTIIVTRLVHHHHTNHHHISHVW